MGEAQPTSLADKRAAVTREAIGDAVAALLVREHPSMISVPDVAREAGVSVRTVYRYFPNKQALLDHVAHNVRNDLEQMGATAPEMYAQPDRWIPELWRLFASDIGSIRAQHMSPAGADLRDRRLGHNRTQLLAQLEKQFPAADADDLRKLTDAAIAVFSSRMFLELHDRMGWDVDEAADLSAWIIRAMYAEFDRKGMS